MKPGDRVRITAGAYKGRLGTLHYHSRSWYVFVYIDDVRDAGPFTFVISDVEDATLDELARL
jgi:hypothetical protein